MIIDFKIGLVILTQVKTRLLKINFFGENWIGSMKKPESGFSKEIRKT
jgi:hypothetical protein